jgi:GT2 family glycosyltransferase
LIDLAASGLKSLLAIWLAARVDIRQALAGIGWWLRGKRVRGRNLILQAASQHPDYYRYWIRAIEPVATAALLKPTKSALELHFVLLAGDCSEAANIAASSRSIEKAVKAAEAKGIRAFELNLADGGKCLSRLPTRPAEGARSVWLIPVIAGDIIAPTTALYLANLLNIEPTTGIAYWDEDQLDRSGRRDPWVKGAFDSLLFLGRDGLIGACAFAASHLQSLVATYGDQPADASGLFGLLATAALEGGLEPVQHIPAILTHRSSWPVSAEIRARIVNAVLTEQQSGRAYISGSVPDLVEIRPDFAASPPSVTVIIPTRNRADLLRACFGGLKKLSYPGQVEFTVIDNGSDEPDSLAYLEELVDEGVKVLRDDGAFNFSRLNNIAVRHSKNDLICMLNNDVEALDGEWLTAMAAYAARPDVGAVGALLLYPDASVQHAGVEIGVGKGAGHAHRFVKVTEPGHSWLHRSTRHVSAVTAACLLVHRSDYLAVGGLDEEIFAVAFNDVDFCLKLQAFGRRNVYVAEAMLVHHESLSRQSDYLPQNIARFMQEFDALKSKWRSDIVIDPYRSPLLADESEKHLLAY